jgi:cephalosporin-C deacetylase
MQQISEQIAKCEALDIPQTKQPDFDAFWAEALKRCGTVPLNVQGGVIDYPVPKMEVRDLTFEGLDGTPVHTWLILPPEAKEKKVPVIVQYHGAGWHRGEAFDFAPWIMAGCAVVSCDFRMQRGDTGSNTGFDGSVKFGWWTLGITDLKNSYLYCTWTDCLRAVRLARETKEIDSKRIAVEGGSQGGGMALGMAALDRSIALCMADVPSNCWMDERVFRRSGGANGIADYLKAYPERVELVSKALSYFDNINHASNITCPTLVSYGLKDPVCPPDTIYAAYNKVTAPKEMVVYPFAEHEGGGPAHHLRKAEFVRRHFFK